MDYWSIGVMYLPPPTFDFGTWWEPVLSESRRIDSSRASHLSLFE
jgi:hypothetical protein